MSLMMRACLIAIVVFLAGCSEATRHGDRSLRVAPETLIGRWSALPKDVADEEPGTRDSTGALGERIAFRWEFRADHTMVTYADVKSGPVPVPEVHGAVTTTWKVLEVRGNTLTIEMPQAGLRPRATIVFESKDKCHFDCGEGQVMVLTRLP
ncbi:MAG TPA: hypothetical protein VGZ22_01590 [Isosphaeraceae bacterium]|nr:hypothetical protein [Isosphaeraceae bacterium]